MVAEPPEGPSADSGEPPPRAPSRPAPWPSRDSPWPDGARSSLTSAPAPAAKPDGPKGFLLGDPRRPRSLALALVIAIASFPVLWFGVLILYALGEGDTTGNAEQGIASVAAVPVAIGLLAASVGWINARLSYPADARGALAGREGIVS